MMRRRPTLTLAGLALALVAAVQPAAAFTETFRSGTVYSDGPNVVDEASSPGVRCIYHDNAGDTNDTLDRIKLVIFNTHSPYSNKAYVGFRMTILRDAPPYDGVFVTYDSKPMVKRKANMTEVASFTGTWNKPSGVTGRFRVVIKLNFYKPGTSTGSQGEYRGRIDVYAHKFDGVPAPITSGDPGDPGDYTDPSTPGYCYPKFPHP